MTARKASCGEWLGAGLPVRAMPVVLRATTNRNIEILRKCAERAAVLIDSMSSYTACSFFPHTLLARACRSIRRFANPPDALVRRFDHAVGVPVAARVVNATFEVKLSPHECEWDKGT